MASIMSPIVQRNPGMELDACPVAKPDTDLNELIDIMVNTDEKYICIMDDNACVGIVTRSGLLRGVQGKDNPDD
jgi:predicted transcriptional regulator